MGLTKVGVTVPSVISGAATVTPTYAADMPRNAGNLAVARIYARGNNPITAPGGWTPALASDPNSGGGTASRIQIFWAILSGGDAAPTFSSSGANPMRAAIEEFTGNGPINVALAASAISKTDTLGASGILLAAGAAPISPGAMAITAYGEHMIASQTVLATPDTGWSQGPWNGGSSGTHLVGGDRQENLPTGVPPTEYVLFGNGAVGSAVIGSLFTRGRPIQTPTRFERSSSGMIWIPTADVLLGIIIIFVAGSPSGYSAPSLFYGGRGADQPRTLMSQFPRQVYNIPTVAAPQNFIQNLTGGLSFTGPTNLKAATAKTMTGNLSFTGPTKLKNAIAKALVAGLSFTGPTNLRNAIAKTMTGGLSFTGPATLPHVIAKILTGNLTFTGPVNMRLAVNKALTAALSFTGPANLKNAIVKGMTAGLSFTGSGPVRAVTKTLTAAGLSFAGTLAAGKQFFRTNTGTLSFSGSLATRNIFGRTLTAALSFTGSGPGRALVKGLVAALSFTGAQQRAIGKGLTAGLNFSGATGRRLGRILTGSLGFLGSLVGLKTAIPLGVPVAMSVAPNDAVLSGPATGVKLSVETNNVTMPGTGNTQTVVGGKVNPLQ